MNTSLWRLTTGNNRSTQSSDRMWCTTNCRSHRIRVRPLSDEAVLRAKDISPRWHSRGARYWNIDHIKSTLEGAIGRILRQCTAFTGRHVWMISPAAHASDEERRALLPDGHESQRSMTLMTMMTMIIYHLHLLFPLGTTRSQTTSSTGRDCLPNM
jgi:hypothetical protein